jgi:hypothetical protein
MSETKKIKIKVSLLEKAFAEIMPEVEFVDISPYFRGNIAGGARKKLEKRLGKSVVSKNNYLKTRQNKELGK